MLPNIVMKQSDEAWESGYIMTITPDSDLNGPKTILWETLVCSVEWMPYVSNKLPFYLIVYLYEHAESRIQLFLVTGNVLRTLRSDSNIAV